MAGDSEQSGSQVIARAAIILHTLETQPKGLTITELARQTGLARATVHRLVASLEQQQLLMANGGEIRLGPALARLAAAAHTDVIALARPAMETLGRRTRETVDLSVYRGSHAVSVSQYVSDQELRVVSAVGTAFPSHCTAHGKALLAQIDDQTIASVFGEQIEVRTQYSHGNLAALLADVAQIRERGYAVDTEEHALGVCGLGVSINAHLNEHYAISLAVPALRFEDNFTLLLSALKQCKSEIEALVRAN